MKPVRSAVLAAASVLLAVEAAGSGETDEEFFKGKRVRLLVASETGGGYDSYARLLAVHLGRFLPGNPTFVVQNMPGAGGLTAINYLYNVAAKDGSVIANVRRGAPLQEILGKPGVKYVSTKLNWIGSLNNEVTVCTAMKSAGVKTFNDLKETEILLGGTGPNDTETAPAILNNTLGAKFRIISGYPSSTAVALAMERGEIEALCSSYSSQKMRNSSWFTDKRVNVLVQLSTRKHPELPDVPLALDLAPDPETRSLLQVNDAGLEIGRPFVAPPGVPQGRIRTYRDAFMKMTRDGEFLADVAKQQLDVNPVSGDDVQSLIGRISSTDKAVLAKLDSALVYRGTKGEAQINLQIFSGTVAEIQDEGRELVFTGKDGKSFNAKVSSSRTKIRIEGDPVPRTALKAGMSCTVKSPGAGETATDIECK